MGFIGSLIQAGVSGIKTLITNARVGKQVLASGSTVTTVQGGSGSNTQVTASGTVGMPAWVIPLSIGFGVVLLLIVVLKSIFKK